ncbi:MAG: hypothetical protein AABZ60_10630, partial [Planctomycetota bacterium]
QNMGPEDIDDILSSLSYLFADVEASRKLFGEITAPRPDKNAPKATNIKAVDSKTQPKSTGNKKKK